MKYVPNALSLSRIPLSVLLFIFAVNEQWPWAALCMLAALVTDALDGAIARHYKVESKLGGDLLEPLCDLALSVAAVGGLYAAGVWPLWAPVGLVIITVLLQVSHATPFTRLKRHTYYIHPLFFITVVLVAGGFYVALAFNWYPMAAYGAVWGIVASRKEDRIRTWLAGPPATA